MSVLDVLILEFVCKIYVNVWSLPYTSIRTLGAVCTQGALQGGHPDQDSLLFEYFETQLIGNTFRHLTIFCDMHLHTHGALSNSTKDPTT